MSNPLVTSYIYPPIPDRRFDWIAYYDPEDCAGYGPAEQDAIADLKLKLEERSE